MRELSGKPLNTVLDVRCLGILLCTRVGTHTRTLCSHHIGLVTHALTADLLRAAQMIGFLAAKVKAGYLGVTDIELKVLEVRS